MRRGDGGKWKTANGLGLAGGAGSRAPACCRRVRTERQGVPHRQARAAPLSDRILRVHRAMAYSTDMGSPMRLEASRISIPTTLPDSS